MEEKTLISTSEAAKLMGISRIAVLKKIKKGQLTAYKVGRNYVVDRRSLGLISQDLTPAQKRRVEQAVRKAIRDFGPALKRLGRE